MQAQKALDAAQAPSLQIRPLSAPEAHTCSSGPYLLPTPQPEAQAPTCKS